MSKRGRRPHAGQDEHTKWCASCNQFKPRTPEFWYGNRSRPDGLQNRCIACHRMRQDNVHKTQKTERRGLPRRPDQWDRCVRGHTLTDETRLVRLNGLVECRTCQREANLRCARKRREPPWPRLRAEGWLRLTEIEHTYGLTVRLMRALLLRGDVQGMKIRGRWVVHDDAVQPLLIKRGEIPLREAAVLLGLSRQRVFQLVRNGKLTGRRLGHFWYVQLDSICERLALTRVE